MIPNITKTGSQHMLLRPLFDVIGAQYAVLDCWKFENFICVPNF